MICEKKWKIKKNTFTHPNTHLDGNKLIFELEFKKQHKHKPKSIQKKKEWVDN